jgi:hypothetical protein
MLKQVQYDKERGLLRVKRLVRDRIKSLQDDKDGGAGVADSLTTQSVPIAIGISLRSG